MRAQYLQRIRQLSLAPPERTLIAIHMMIDIGLYGLAIDRMLAACRVEADRADGCCPVQFVRPFCQCLPCRCGTRDLS